MEKLVNIAVNTVFYHIFFLFLNDTCNPPDLWHRKFNRKTNACVAAIGLPRYVLQIRQNFYSCKKCLW